MQDRSTSVTTSFEETALKALFTEISIRLAKYNLPLASLTPADLTFLLPRPQALSSSQAAPVHPPTKEDERCGKGEARDSIEFLIELMRGSMLVSDDKMISALQLIRDGPRSPLQTVMIMPVIDGAIVKGLVLFYVRTWEFGVSVLRKILDIWEEEDVIPRKAARWLTRVLIQEVRSRQKPTTNDDEQAVNIDADGDDGVAGADGTPVADGVAVANGDAGADGAAVVDGAATNNAAVAAGADGAAIAGGATLANDADEGNQQEEGVVHTSHSKLKTTEGE
ncbi:hypothetical protein HK102_008363 [Quaeritorhiza haematococci]|nr:hypothetical protein HK102_008363 [Quaeritorhiza haematococci]